MDRQKANIVLRIFMAIWIIISLVLLALLIFNWSRCQDNVKYMIADCGFTSPYEIIAKVFRDVMHIPAWPFLWATEIFARFFAGFSLREKNSVETLQRNQRPIFLIHGLADDFVPCEMTQRSFDANEGFKRLLLVEGAGHGVSFLHAKDKYHAMNLEFMDQFIPKQ